MFALVRFLLPLLFSLTFLHAADSCSTPTATLNLDQTVQGQYIEYPYLEGVADSGQALFYKIVLDQNGTLRFDSATDATHPDDKVNTYAELLDSDCALLQTDTQTSATPRYFTLQRHLTAGTYYLRVYNEVKLDDSDQTLAKGYFQLSNSFSADPVQKDTRLWRTHPDTVPSGDDLLFTVHVKNYGVSSTSSVLVTIPDYPDTLTYVGVENGAGWSCTRATDRLECTLDDGTLATGEEKTFDIRYHSDYLAADKTLTNVAEAQIGYPDGTSVTKTNTRSVIITAQHPHLTLTKDATKPGETTAVSSVIQGQSFDYRLQVTNDGTLNLSSLTLDDTVPDAYTIEGLDYDTSLLHCSYSGQNVSCSSDALAKGQTATIRIRVRATGSTGSDNSATASASSPLGTLSATDNALVDIVPKKYEMTVTKTAASNSVVKGHTTYFDIQVQNSGNMPLSNVTLDDPLPSELTLTDISDATGWDCSASDTASGHVSCSLGTTLDPGYSASLRVHAEANSVASSVTNTATASADTAPDSSASATIQILPPSPSVSIDKSAPGTVTSTQTFYYTFSITNNGTETLRNATVTDTFDSRLEIPADWNDAVPATWNCSVSGHDLQCSYSGDIAPGGGADSLKIKVRAPYTTEDISIDNTAVVNADSDAGGVSGTDTATVTVSKVTYAIAITKMVNTSRVESGNTFIYTLFASNTGNLPQRNVRIVDDLPAIFTNFSVNGGNFDCSASSGNHIDCRLATLDAGATEHLTISVVAPIVTSETTVRNEANVTGEVYVEGQLNETTTANGHADITITPPPSALSVTKTASRTQLLKNETTIYTISVTNDGMASENNVTITDAVPSPLTVVSVDEGVFHCLQSDNDVACLLPELASGATETVKITAQAPDKINTENNVTNSVTVKSDREQTGVNATADVTLVPDSRAVDLHVLSDPTSVFARDTYRYRIFLTNNSGRDIENVTLDDPLPEDVSYVRYESPDSWNCRFDADAKKFSCDYNGSAFSPGEHTIDLYVKAPGYATTLYNTVFMKSSVYGQDQNETATTYVKAKEAHLAFTQAQTDKNPVKMREAYRYLISVQNLADTEASDINATDLNVMIRLDANETLQQISANDWNCSGTKVITCTLGVLPPHATSSQIAIEVVSDLPGQRITTLSAAAKESVADINRTIMTEVKEIVPADLTLSVSDDPDPVEHEGLYTYDFTVVNTHPEKSVEAIQIDVNTTSEANYLLNAYADDTRWRCTQNGKQLQCLMNDAIAPKETVHLVITAQAPSVACDLNITAELSSEYLDDLDPSNNLVQETTHILDTDMNGNHIRPFSRVPIQGEQDTNIYGDILSIGNQSICEQDNNGHCIEPSFMVNDLIEQRQINLDNTHTYFMNATNAYLQLKPDDHVIWAGLYWMGRIDKTQSGATEKISNAPTVYLRHESEVRYIRVNAERDAEAIDNDGNLITGIDKFNFINDSTYFDYQGMADVTDYVQKHKSGTYWVANVQSSEGENISAGWNLVVIVMDTAKIPTRNLRNITVFDGFQGVWKSTNEMAQNYPDEVNQTVAGFITPTHGAIDSKLYMFAFEGDKTLDDYIKLTDIFGIEHYLTNGANPTNDVVNGTVSENGTINLARTPALQNTSGIDIDTFYVGDDNNGSGIIRNGQRETTITIGSGDGTASDVGGDRFFLGMFAFSTNLYQPLCYHQSFKTGDFSAPLPDQVHMGDTVGIEVEIRNTEIQDVEHLQLYTFVDPVLKEDNSSYEIRNLDSSGLLESNFHRADTLFDTQSVVMTADQNQTMITTRTGSGANGTTGGTLYGGKNIFYRFKAKIEDLNEDNRSVALYKASFEPTDKKVMLPPCGTQQQFPIIKINQTNGFNVLHQNALGDNVIDGLENGDPSKPNNETHLFTQVTGKPFQIDVVALDDHDPRYLHPVPYKGIVELELVDYNASQTCKTFTSRKSADVVFDTTRVKQTTFTFSDAAKQALFRVRYLVDKYGKLLQWDTTGSDLTTLANVLQKSGTEGVCTTECIGAAASYDQCKACLFKEIDQGGLARVSCALDTFAVRPHHVAIDINATHPLRGGKPYDLHFDANTTSYDSTVDASSGSLTATLQIPSGCALTPSTTSNLLSSTLQFGGGKATLSNFSYPNVGAVQVDFRDRIWTQGDQNLTDQNMSDCIVGSSSETPDASGRVGCEVPGSGLFRFVPASFKTTAALSAPTGGYVYFSNDLSMSGRLALTMTALLDNGATATNYTSGCYAKDLNLTIQIGTEPEDWNGRADLNSSVIFGGDGTQTLQFAPNGFTVPQAFFSGGTASSVPVFVNFKRKRTQPQDPITLHKNDFNTSVTDSDGVTGGDFDKSGDMTIPYYYGRVYATSIQTDERTLSVPLYYEAYCKDANLSKYFPTHLEESLDQIHWYKIDDLHTSATQGSVVTANAKNGLHIDAIHLHKLELSLPNSIKLPHLDTVIFKPSSWLQHNNFSETRTTSRFTIRMFPKAKWGGQGSVGKTVDLNISTKSDGAQIDW